MRVYVLGFERARNLKWAFHVISESNSVASCTFEPHLCRVRFVAPSSEADTLVERIYLDGGLVSCSRHNVKLTLALDCAHPARLGEDHGARLC